MQYKKIEETDIAVVEYASVKELLFDQTKQTKAFFNKRKPKRVKSVGTFAFIYKLPIPEPDYFLVINVFDNSYVIEAFSPTRIEGMTVESALAVLPNDVTKAVRMLERYSDDDLHLTKKEFNDLINVFSTGFKPKRISNYDYVHINDLLSKISRDKKNSVFFSTKRNNVK